MVGAVAHARYREASHFGALDGLRAVAAAAVVWHHAGHAAAGYFGRGVGVTTFFVISGFLITRLLLVERERTGTVAIGRFWLRRALRIFPLYFAVLGLYVVLVARVEHGTAAGQAFWQALPYYLTFTTNWCVDLAPGERVIFYFAWSLAVQEQFYLLWPLVVRFARFRTASLVPFAFLLSAEVGAWLLGLGLLRPGWTYRALTSADTPIFYGVLAAFALQSRWGFPWAQRLAGQPWSLPLALALVLLPAVVPAVTSELLGLFITYLVVACVLAPTRTARLLDQPLTRHVGKVSYGVYLLHMLALNAVSAVIPGLGTPARFALGLPLAVLAATATHRWLEAPALRLREPLAARLAVARVPLAVTGPQG
jgi:peptidoglycan/LPS O-acetylase OafA/YrhL